MRRHFNASLSDVFSLSSGGDSYRFVESGISGVDDHVIPIIQSGYLLRIICVLFPCVRGRLLRSVYIKVEELYIYSGHSPERLRQDFTESTNSLISYHVRLESCQVHHPYPPPPGFGGCVPHRWSSVLPVRERSRAKCRCIPCTLLDLAHSLCCNRTWIS